MAEIVEVKTGLPGGDALRVLGGATLLIVLYYTLPLDTRGDAGSVITLPAGLLALVVVVAWQLRQNTQSDRPGLRAIETLATAIPLYILLFATVYYLAAQAAPSNFNQALDRTNALYFSMTVLSTVGFGDITATTDAAQLVVTTQMTLDLILFAVGPKSYSAP